MSSSTPSRPGSLNPVTLSFAIRSLSARADIDTCCLCFADIPSPLAVKKICALCMAPTFHKKNMALALNDPMHPYLSTNQQDHWDFFVVSPHLPHQCSQWYRLHLHFFGILLGSLNLPSTSKGFHSMGPRTNFLVRLVACPGLLFSIVLADAEFTSELFACCSYFCSSATFACPF